jgi:K+-transporting ATPase KdpF subunit
MSPRSGRFYAIFISFTSIPNGILIFHELSFMRSFRNLEFSMPFEWIAAVVLVAFFIFYLVYAILRPEKF